MSKEIQDLAEMTIRRLREEVRGLNESHAAAINAANLQVASLKDQLAFAQDQIEFHKNSVIPLQARITELHTVNDQLREIIRPFKTFAKTAGCPLVCGENDAVVTAADWNSLLSL